MEIQIKGLPDIEMGDWRLGDWGSESGMACDSSLENLEMAEEEGHDEGWEYDHRD